MINQVEILQFDGRFHKQQNDFLLDRMLNHGDHSINMLVSFPKISTVRIVQKIDLSFC